MNFAHLPNSIKEYIQRGECDIELIPAPVVIEGTVEGTVEGTIEGTVEGAIEGTIEGAIEGADKNEGVNKGRTITKFN